MRDTPLFAVVVVCIMTAIGIGCVIWQWMQHGPPCLFC